MCAHGLFVPSVHPGVSPGKTYGVHEADGLGAATVSTADGAGDACALPAPLPEEGWATSTGPERPSALTPATDTPATSASDTIADDARPSLSRRAPKGSRILIDVHNEPRDRCVARALPIRRKVAGG